MQIHLFSLVVPRSPEAELAFRELGEEILSNGGEATPIEARLLAGQSDADVRILFDNARDADYDEVAQAAWRLLETGPASGADIAKLQTRLEEVGKLNSFGSHGRQRAKAALAELDRQQQRRYRYYVSSAAGVSDAADKSPALRLPAPELEQVVIDAISDLLSDQRIIMALPQVDARALVQRTNAAQALASKMEKSDKAQVRQQLQSLGIATVVSPDRIEASISQRLLIAMLDGTAPAADDDGVRLPVDIPTKPDRRGTISSSCCTPRRSVLQRSIRI